MANHNITPGEETSEFRSTRISQWMGIGLVIAGVLGVIVAQVQELYGHNPQVLGITSIILTAIGAFTKVAASLGYTVQRTKLKIADMESDATIEAAHAVGPPVQAAPAIGTQIIQSEKGEKGDKGEKGKPHA